MDSYTPVPVLEYEKEAGRNEDDLYDMPRDMEGIPGEKHHLQVEELKPLDREARLEYALKRIAEFGGMPPGKNLVEMKRFVDLFAANRKAMNQYKPRHYQGRVVLLSAAEKPSTKIDAAQGWDQYVSRDNLEIRQVPRDHYTMLRPPHVKSLARKIEASISKKSSPGPQRQDRRVIPKPKG